jgi:hypothetical protein
MRLADAERERDVVERAHAGERLDDAVELPERPGRGHRCAKLLR